MSTLKNRKCLTYWPSWSVFDFSS